METHKLQGAAVRLPPGEDTPPSLGVFPAGVVFALTKRSLRHDMAVDGSWDWKGGRLPKGGAAPAAHLCTPEVRKPQDLSKRPSSSVSHCDLQGCREGGQGPRSGLSARRPRRPPPPKAAAGGALFSWGLGGTRDQSPVGTTQRPAQGSSVCGRDAQVDVRLPLRRRARAEPARQPP